MDSHQSCEKLVAAEAGLVLPNLTNDRSFLKISRRNGSSTRNGSLTNWLLGSVFVVLLVLISYEIWQTVRREQLIREFETEDVPSPGELLPSVLEDARIQVMAEELKRVQDTLREIQEKIHRQNTIRTTTDLPKTTTSDPKIDLIAQDFERELFKELLQESTTDDLLANTGPPKYAVSEEDVIQDSSDSDSSEPLLIASPVRATESGFKWAFSFHFGKGSGEQDTSEKSNATESGETGTPLQTEMDVTSSDQGGWGISFPKISYDLFSPFQWSWGFGNLDEDDSGSSESVETIEEDEDPVEIQTSMKPLEETTTEKSPELYADYYYDTDDSYEYDPWWQTDSLNYESEGDISDEDFLEETTTESTLSATTDEDKDKIVEPMTTVATVSSTAAFHPTESSSGYAFDDVTDSYYLGSPTDQLQQLPSQGVTPNSKDTEETSSSAEEKLEDSSDQDDSSARYGSIDDYFAELFAKRLREADYLNQQYVENEKNGKFMKGQSTDYSDHDLQPVEGWSYISKRSVDTPSVIDTSVRQLTAKELEHKMSLLLRQIDNDNHLLQNEVSLAPESAKNTLRRKLNNFYAKMEAVSAHIDQLHERYVRLNELDDDYVSKEFPVEDTDARY